MTRRDRYFEYVHAQEITMPIAHEILAALPLTALMSATALGASITGTISGPDGGPFMGAIVAAENPQSRMTVNVLSDVQGRYRISNLPGATYTVCNLRANRSRRIGNTRPVGGAYEGMFQIRTCAVRPSRPY